MSSAHPKLDVPFAGARTTKNVTQRHSPLVWENMLGTVRACNAEGKVEYFDYAYEAAHAFAGTKECKDLRVCRAKTSCEEFRKGKWVLWGIREGQVK